MARSRGTRLSVGLSREIVWRNIPLPRAHLMFLVACVTAHLLAPMAMIRFVLMSRFLGLAALLVSIALVGWAVKRPEASRWRLRTGSSIPDRTR
jgi:hypothetical protein